MNKEDIFNFIKNNDINKVNKWLKLYPNNINVINNHGLTPLHRACWKGKIEIVQYLIDKGVDVNSKDNEDRTPLDNLNDEYKQYILNYIDNKINSDNNNNNLSFRVGNSFK